MMRSTRRTHGGRKLWESKDERKWGHDKFEEITFQDRHYQEGRRSSKGQYRGRGRGRGIDRGYGRGNRSRAYNDSTSQNQVQVPKSVRGKGLRKYEPAMKNNGMTRPLQNKQSGKPPEKSSHSNSGRTFTSASNAESESVSSRKNVFASSLNSASPPFYPSASSNKDINPMQRRALQGGGANRSIRASAGDESLSGPRTNAYLQGKNVTESIGMDRLSIDDSINSAAVKTFGNTQMSTGSPLVNTVSTTQSTQSRVHGRAVNPGQMTYQPVPHNPVIRASSSTPHPLQRGNVHSRGQTAGQTPAQQLGQRPGSGSQASSPPKTALSINSFDSVEVESSSESSKSKNALIGKGKGVAQGSGRGSIMYGGAQVIGATGSMSVSHGDQNFPAPAFLPVMQFGGQHPGGIGVPAVGMAFPGYVAQPQLGMGKSEMTWLPVLAGAAGAYCPPYIAVDGAYHAHPSGQTSSGGASSKENNGNKPNTEWKSSQKPEIVSDEFGQRQNKPRRYSEMNFGQ